MSLTILESMFILSKLCDTTTAPFLQLYNPYAANNRMAQDFFRVIKVK